MSFCCPFLGPHLSTQKYRCSMKSINRIRPAYLNGGHVRPHILNGDPSPFGILCCASLNFSCCTGGREEVCEALLTRRLLGSLPIHWANALQFQSGMQKCGATAISCYSPLHSFHQLRTAFKYLRLLLVNLLIFSRNLTLALLSALRTSSGHCIGYESTYNSDTLLVFRWIWPTLTFWDFLMLKTWSLWTAF